MTVVERIGELNVVKHGPVFMVIGRKGQDPEVYTDRRSAFGRALERADLVDGLAALFPVRH